MTPSLLLVAAMLLAAPADPPGDAAGWRDRSDALFRQGLATEALQAATEARRLDDANPWSRYAWVRALAATDANLAREALPGLFGDAGTLPAAERANLLNALGYLALELGLEPLAAGFFGQVPATTAVHAEAQAGLAIVAARGGDPEVALARLEAQQAQGRLPGKWEAFARDLRFAVAQREFRAAHESRNANAAGRALAIMDELRPRDPGTLRARADLAGLRGDPAARERALRDLLATDPAAPGTANDLIDTLLELHRPHAALSVARGWSRERLANDGLLQALERNWTTHVEAAATGRQRDGESGLEELGHAGAHLGLVLVSGQLGRFRIAVDAHALRTDPVASSTPYGTSVSLPTATAAPRVSGAAPLLHWAPRPGWVLELGGAPGGFLVDNFYGALRWRSELDHGPVAVALEREPVTDSQLSYSGLRDPASNIEWGGVVRNRLRLNGSWGDEQAGFYGQLGTSVLTGRRVEDNSQWEAGLGYWRRAATGARWQANIGANLTAFGYADNLSRFTLGHGGYFSPQRFIAIGPTFDLQALGDTTSFRLEGGLAWQRVDEESVAFFPEDPVRQAASGNARYAGGERDGLGARLAATLEWRLTAGAIAGLRLEGLHGEDYEEIRLQVYARGWKGSVTEPLRYPPRPVLPVEFSERL